MKRKYSLLLFSIFASFIVSAYSIYNTIERVGNTQLNGNGCVCHSLYASPQVETWFVGPDSLLAGQTAHYKVFLRGGPAIAGGYNVAARFGTLGLLDTISIIHWGELTQRMALPFPTPTDTIFWEFTYTAPDSVEMDTLYAASLSIDDNGDPDSLDLWNFSPKFPIRILPNVVPVELTNFSGRIENDFVILNWKTASEKNNLGFEIQRSALSDQRTENVVAERLKLNAENWTKIGFVDGAGTTDGKQNYFFTDKNISAGKYLYRLKQIDYDGKFTYSHEVEVEVISPEEFVLYQNYPNPFNPNTVIKYAVGNASAPLSTSSSRQLVTLKVFDILGNEVSTLVNEMKEEGRYEIIFDASTLPSGIYFYQLTSGKFSSTKKFVLMK